MKRKKRQENSTENKESTRAKDTLYHQIARQAAGEETKEASYVRPSVLSVCLSCPSVCLYVRHNVQKNFLSKIKMEFQPFRGYTSLLKIFSLLFKNDFSQPFTRLLLSPLCFYYCNCVKPLLWRIMTT